MKEEALKQLGKLRQSKCYKGYSNIGDYHKGKYETYFVSPYTKSSCNVDSEIMVLLRVWTTKNNIENDFGEFGEEVKELGYSPALDSNKNLDFLLNCTFYRGIENVFTTNVFPYIMDSSSMTDKIPEQDMQKAFDEFCLPQIKIVNPRLVICCGKEVYKTAYYCLIGKGHSKMVVNNFFIWNNDKKAMRFVYQKSTGSVQFNTNGGYLERQNEWRIMKDNFESI